MYKDLSREVLEEKYVMLYRFPSHLNILISSYLSFSICVMRTMTQPVSYHPEEL